MLERESENITDPMLVAWARYKAADRTQAKTHDAEGPANDIALRDLFAAIRAFSKTPATTLSGVLIKLRYVERGIRIGKGDYDAAILRSAIADLRRLLP